MVKLNDSSNLYAGTLDIITLQMSEFDPVRPREIRVWLPEGYNPEDKEKRYPVLYMHDGQNLFEASTSFAGEWKIDETVSRRMEDGKEPMIVVGIDNGDDRINELSPEWGLSNMGARCISYAQGSKYAEFVAVTVKDYVDSHYNTKPEREYTGVAGSSMGGIMSLYLVMEHPEIYSYGLIFSPALQDYPDDVVEDKLKSFCEKTTGDKPLLYLYSGGVRNEEEPGAPYDEASIYRYPEYIHDILKAEGYPEENMKVSLKKEMDHCEAAWASEFVDALQWVLDR